MTEVKPQDLFSKFKTNSFKNQVLQNVNVDLKRLKSVIIRKIKKIIMVFCNWSAKNNLQHFSLVIFESESSYLVLFIKRKSIP